MNRKFTLLALATALAACGGGDVKEPVAPTTPALASIQGVAATGAALANAPVQAACSGSDTPFTTTTNPRGEFTLPLPASALPCLLRLSPDNGNALYGLAGMASPSSSRSLANVTPLTSLILERAARISNLPELAQAFATRTGIATLLAGSPAANDQMKEVLTDGQYHFNGGDFSQFNPLSALFAAQSGDAYDDLLEEMARSGAFSDGSRAAFREGEHAAYPRSADAAVPETPPANCLPQTISWQEGESLCRADMAALDHGAQRPLVDDIAPTTGNASAQCGDGRVTVLNGARCSTVAPPPPEPEPPQDINAITRSQDGCSLTQQIGSGTASKGIRIVEASWLQVVQKNALSGSENLSGGKEVLLRIDPVASAANTPMPTSGKVGIFSDGSCTVLALTRKATVMPAQISPATLDNSLVATIPASLVKSGMSFVAVLDTSTPQHAQDADNSVIQGRVNVLPPNRDVLNLYVLSVDGRLGQHPPTADVENLLRRIFPLARSEVHARGVFTPKDFQPESLPLENGVRKGTPQHAGQLIGEFSQFCRETYVAASDSRNGSHEQKCLLVWPLNLSLQLGGMGELTGVTSIATEFPATDRPEGTPTQDWIEPFAQTILHEQAHVYGLNHADCGSPPGVDARLYPDGALGTQGFYDHHRGIFVTNRERHPSTRFYDVTAYCGPGLISDKAYNVVDNYLVTGLYDTAPGSAAAASPAPDERWLMVRWTGKRLVALPVPRIPLKTRAATREAMTLLGALGQGAVVRQADYPDAPGVLGVMYVKLSQARLATVQALLRDKLEVVSP